MKAVKRVFIRPTRGISALQFAELWEYRELLYFLVWRDVKVRYKQTLLGATWAILQPVLGALVFNLFFGVLMKVPSGDLPYPVFVYAGLLPWQLFSSSLSESSNSLVASQQLVKKVFFPKLLLPIAPVIGGLVDFFFAFMVLIGMMFFYQIKPTAAILLLPGLVGLAMLTALAAGIWLSALNVRYRDVRYTVPFLTQVWFYATPIVYSSSVVPEKWRPLLGLNPMAGVIEGFRWALLGTGNPPSGVLWVSVVVIAAVLTAGVYYFRSMERTFADIV